MAKILIIGGGVAGLSAGIYAQMAGHETVICEQHSVAGGSLTHWARQGYHIDNCIHWLTGTNPASSLYRLWCDLGALDGVEIYKRPALFTMDFRGERLGLSRDLDELIERLCARSPRDAGELRALRKVIDTFQGFQGIAGKGHDQAYDNKKMAARLPGILKYFNLSVEDLAKRFHDPLIRHFIAGLVPGNFGALALIFTAAGFFGDNADLPEGGSAAMARRITERYRALGGTLLLNKTAVQIELEGGRATAVRFADGTRLSADAVIVTLDPACVFGKLLDVPMPQTLAKEYGRLERFSAVHCAFACDLAQPSVTGDVSFPLPRALHKTMGGAYLAVRNDHHETDYTPAGKSLLQTMVYCDEETARHYIELRKTNLAAYRKEKRRIARLTQKILEAKFPELAGTLTVLDVWTPATYRRYLGTEMGSFMSFALPKRRLPIRKSNRIPGVANVVLAGQWLQMPGGLPIAARTGRDAAAVLEELFG